MQLDFDKPACAKCENTQGSLRVADDRKSFECCSKAECNQRAIARAAARPSSKSTDLSRPAATTNPTPPAPRPRSSLGSCAPWHCEQFYPLTRRTQPVPSTLKLSLIDKSKTKAEQRRHLQNCRFYEMVQEEFRRSGKNVFVATLPDALKPRPLAPVRSATPGAAAAPACSGTTGHIDATQILPPGGGPPGRVSQPRYNPYAPRDNLRPTPPPGSGCTARPPGGGPPCQVLSPPCIPSSTAAPASRPSPSIPQRSCTATTGTPFETATPWQAMMEALAAATAARATAARHSTSPASSSPPP